ncbi:MAG: NADH-quinone oxidoreductase subunit J [Acidobacteriota bacterium]
MVLNGAEAWFFWVLALSALMGGLFTVLSRSAVHSAICLMMTLIATAGLFLLLHAEFVMAVQILVYVGGVIVLFLFVVMLVNVREEKLDQARLFSRQWVLAIICASLLAVGFWFAIRLSDPYENLRPSQEATASASAVSYNAQGATPVSKNAEDVGWALYTQAALPFEIASVLLLVAILGSVLLARTARQEQLAEEETET